MNMNMYKSKKFQAMTEEQMTAYFEQLWADNEMQEFYDNASETEMIDFGNWSMGQPSGKPKPTSKSFANLLKFFES